MSSGRPVRLAVAEGLAAKLLEALAPACVRVEVAGSVRRRAPMVSDLEIVAAPVLQRDLFGEVDELAPVALDEVLGGLFESGRLALRDVGAGVRNGPRYKALVAVRSGVPVDLFVVRPPATWGVTMAIRTGPRDYSRHLVTALLARGLRSEGGRVLRSNGEPLPTPEERHVFEFAGIPYLAPELRA